MKTHWKKLRNPLYLGSYDFEEKEERTLKITKVEKIPVMGADGKQEDCTVCHFEGSKPMILNSTNAKAITKATGTPYIEEWAGKTVTLYTQKIRAFGEMVDALRIKTTVAKVLPTLDDKRFTDALKAIEAKTYTVEQLKATYTLTPQQLAKI